MDGRFLCWRGRRRPGLYLRQADVAVTLDRWDNPPGASISRFIEQIEASAFVCAVGSRFYRNKDTAKNADPVVRAELRLIKTKLRKRDEVQATIIPVLREGTPEEAFPPLFEDSVHLDFREECDFFLHLFELVLSIHRVALGEEMAREHRGRIVTAARALPLAWRFREEPGEAQTG